MASIEQVLARLKGVQKSGPDQYTAFCPAHENVKTQALSVSGAPDGKILLHCFGNECSFESICEALKFEPKELMGSDNIFPIRETVTLDLFARKIGLSVQFLQKLGWSDTQSKTAVAIPYKDAQGAHQFSKLRVSVHGNPKYTVKPGTALIAYGLQYLRHWREEGKTQLFLVEGETDAATLWNFKIPALGIPGSGAVNGTLRALYLKGFQEVYAVQESDSAGEKFVQRIGELMEQEKVAVPLKVLKFPEGIKDTNDLYREDPENFAKQFDNLTHAATPWKDTENTQFLIPLADLANEESEKLDFLWNPYVPEGEVTILFGKPGIGKSLCTMYLGAALTRGWKLIGGSENGSSPKKVSTLYLAGEDDPQRILIPRARKASADLSKLFVVNREQWPVDLWVEECIDDLVARTTKAEIGLVVIDPIQAWISYPKFNMNDPMHVRRVMSGLKRLCVLAKLTVLVVAHDKKGEGASSLDLVLGSRDLTAAVRSVVMLSAHPTIANHGILTHSKHNFSAAGPSWEYRVDSEDGKPSLSWVSQIDVTAEDLAQEKQLGQDLVAREDAIQLLKGMISGTDKIEVKEIIAEGKKQGIGSHVLRRARKYAGLEPRRYGTKWFWVRCESSEDGETQRDEAERD